jgi:hypothetical protein
MSWHDDDRGRKAGADCISYRKPDALPGGGWAWARVWQWPDDIRPWIGEEAFGWRAQVARPSRFGGYAGAARAGSAATREEAEAAADAALIALLA